MPTLGFVYRFPAREYSLKILPKFSAHRKEQPSSSLMALPVELKQEVYGWCDIDTKLSLRRAHNGLVDFKEGKMSVNIRHEPLTVYHPDRPGRVPLNIPFLVDNPWNTMTRKPWVMGEPEGGQWVLIWGRYRVIRGNCYNCQGDEYSTFTCNETDCVKPGYLIQTKRIDLPASCANNWLGSVCSVGCPRNCR